MYPPFSVVFFTITSGAGFGLYILLMFANVFLSIANKQILFVGILSLTLISIGFFSSTFHLGNPRNMWRAFSQYKTSWLSREAVFAVNFYPFAISYLLLIFLDPKSYNHLQTILIVINVFLAFASLVSTGMIYGCLKTIRSWNTSFTPINFVLTALTTGGLLLLLFINSEMLIQWLIDLLCFSFFIQFFHFKRNQKLIKTSTSHALGLKRDNVTLSNKGHASPTFIDNEFSYHMNKSSKTKLYLIGFILAYLLPVTFLLLCSFTPLVMIYLAIGVSFIGSIILRWLFFADACHVVNCYI